MLEFSLQTLDLFTSPLDNHYVTPMPTLTFFSEPPDFTEIRDQRVHHTGPFLGLIPANTRVWIHCKGGRRNWAAVFDSNDIRPSEDPRSVELRSQGQWVRMPAVAPVEPAFVSALERQWEEMRAAHREGLPGSRLNARMGIITMIQRLLDGELPQLNHSPAARLKRAIDEDSHQALGLEELSDQCGFSTDHLRRLFKQTYGIAPHQYRHQRRMARAMELIANSDLTIKEIGSQLGCRHMSHFTGLFRKEFSMSPREAVATFRLGGSN